MTNEVAYHPLRGSFPRGEAESGVIADQGLTYALSCATLKMRDMRKTNNPKLKKNAQELRHNMTDEERRLWYAFLKPMGMNWYRQHVIGRYIVDFYCAKAKMVIELDGAQHYEGNAPDYDAKRDQYLSSLGLYVLRITNYDLNKNFDRVCEIIRNYIDSLPIFDE